MNIKEILREGDLIKGPWGDKKIAKDSDGYGTMLDLETGKKVSKPVDTDSLEQIPLRKVFGGGEYNIIYDLGYKFDEKPSDFNSIENEIPKGMLGLVQRSIGRKLYTYKQKDILVRNKINGNYFPQADANWDALHNDEETFIVRTSTGDMFLANRTGASSYIRMWMRIS
jgi:hypothetical protein